VVAVSLEYLHEHIHTNLDLISFAPGNNCLAVELVSLMMRSTKD
jgi:hypothetical protein